MPIDWWSREQLPFTLMIILGIIGLILSEGGYRLGWWNDSHLAGIVVSAVALALGVVATWLLGASRGQAVGIRQDVRQVGSQVREVGAQVREVGAKVDQVGAKVDHVGSEVREARRAIVTHQEQQTAVLVEIRDRLPPRAPHP